MYLQSARLGFEPCEAYLAQLVRVLDAHQMPDHAPRVLDGRLHLLELLHDVGVRRRLHRVELGLEAREVGLKVCKHILHRRLHARRFDLVKLGQARLLEQSAPGLGSGRAHSHRATAQAGHGRAQHRVGDRDADEQHDAERRMPPNRRESSMNVRTVTSYRQTC